MSLGGGKGSWGRGTCILPRKTLDTCKWVVLRHHRAKSLEHKGGSYRQKWLMGNHDFGFTHDHHTRHTARNHRHVYPVWGGRFRLCYLAIVTEAFFTHDHTFVVKHGKRLDTCAIQGFGSHDHVKPYDFREKPRHV